MLFFFPNTNIIGIKEEKEQVGLMKLDMFFAKHPIFTMKELYAFAGMSYRMTSTLANLLQYHKNQGHILLIRRGLYAVIAQEFQGIENQIDPYIIASKLALDSVLGYHTALTLHGKTNTHLNVIYFLTRSRPKRNFEFQQNIYQAVSIPSSLKNRDIGIHKINRLGMPILLTSLERTFVDILDRPYLCLSWEEICRSIEGIEYLDSEMVLEYTLLLSNRTTAAIVGFFTEMYREKWMIPQKHIDALAELRPHKPVYLKRSTKGSQKLIPAWNLIIPKEILNKRWEEPHEDI